MGLPATLDAQRKDFLALCRRVIQGHLAQAQALKARLQLPRAPEPMRSAKDMHFHAAPEIYFQLGGAARLRLLHETLLLKRGHWLIVPRGIAHHESVMEPRSAFRNMIVMLQPEWVSFHVSSDNGAGRPTIRKMETLPSHQGPRLADHFSEAAALGLKPEGAARPLQSALLQAGLAGLLQVLEGGPAAAEAEDPLIARAQLLIAGHWNEADLSVARLAATLGCSADHLSRRFHDVMGATLTSRLNQTRLAHARELLDASTLSVKEIAWASGYEDPGYFIRLFRKMQGMTPRAFRQRKGVREER